MRFWDRLNSHAPAIQALGAILTVLLTLGAVVGVKLQIDASAKLQREQSARDIYREFLNLSISRTDLSDPDVCKFVTNPQQTAYAAYVEYLLYTAEQTLAASPDWESALNGRLKDHRKHLCEVDDWSAYTPEVQSIMKDFRTEECKVPIPVCPDDYGTDGETTQPDK